MCQEAPCGLLSSAVALGPPPTPSLGCKVDLPRGILSLPLTFSLSLFISLSLSLCLATCVYIHLCVCMCVRSGLRVSDYGHSFKSLVFKK